MVFTGKQHVQFESKPQSPESRRKLNYCLLPNTPHFSLLSTFKQGTVPLSRERYLF
jgi:hypothetical protein